MPPSPDPYDLADVPRVDEYQRALLACRGMPDNQLKMLKEHYYAPGHTVTAGALAERVGFPNFNAANLQYGAFASNLCLALGRKPEIKVAILATFSEGDLPGEEFIKWTMLPQVVEALEQLGWVRRGR